jgi:hypothetical protein
VLGMAAPGEGGGITNIPLSTGGGIWQAVCQPLPQLCSPYSTLSSSRSMSSSERPK